MIALSRACLLLLLLLLLLRSFAEEIQNFDIEFLIIENMQ